MKNRRIPKGVGNEEGGWRGYEKVTTGITV